MVQGEKEENICRASERETYEEDGRAGVWDGGMDGGRETRQREEREGEERREESVIRRRPRGLIHLIFLLSLELLQLNLQQQHLLLLLLLLLLTTPYNYY